ncbi:hypothetical protein GGR50DRAFT_683554 [Xylaria sp. CBS 124048]|nr:hypothetical protein GGR50DRAFT_683554 [Xylaria sp. CBS 124048]
MLFSKTFATGLAMAATALATATPQQIADGLASITKKSLALQAPAQSVTIVNAALIVIGQGPFPSIIAGFNDIVDTATVLAKSIGAAPSKRSADDNNAALAAAPVAVPVTVPVKMHARDLMTRDANADLVDTAFREFVRVHQNLLNILIGKADILTSIPIVGAPVAQALRNDEGILDPIAIALINLFPAQALDIQVQANSLGGTLDLAISKYTNLQA